MSSRRHSTAQLGRSPQAGFICFSLTRMPRAKNFGGRAGLATSITSCFGRGFPCVCSGATIVGQHFETLISYDGQEIDEEDLPPRLTKLGSQSVSSQERLKRVKSLPTKLKCSTDTLASKFKEAYEQLMDAARKSSPHINELFVGNQLLMHVTAMSISRRNKCLAPPPGVFVESSTDNSLR